MVDINSLMNDEFEHLNKLTIKELSGLYEKTASEIMILNENSESTQNDIKLEKKIQYFNAIKSIIIESHSDENYPRGG
ncbi:MAG: hypothetical protein CL775_05280 [Chloroflexi bacterium]|nr:hypothetical protein [Chloroflexota bacterium]